MPFLASSVLFRALLLLPCGVLLYGCAQTPDAPLPPSAFLGGIEPPEGFDPYLTPAQRLAQGGGVASGFGKSSLSSDSRAGETADGSASSVAAIETAAALLDAPATQAAIEQAAASTKWSIVIVAFRGAMADAAGLAALNKVEAAGVSGAYLERRGESVALAYGRFDSPDEPAARESLDALRAIEIEGERPFAGAVLAPPSPDLLTGSLPQFDLRTVKEKFGPDALYTLQIGVYGRADRTPPESAELAEYRRTAERAVYDLRRQGEEAYYYHAPMRSMVTIGVFGPDDHDPKTPGLESKRLGDTRLRHPHNTLNGQGIRERIPNRPANDPTGWKLQPSALVGVPRS